MKIKRFLKSLDVVVGTTVLSSLFLLLNNTSVYAEGSTTDEVTVTVPVSCSITNTVNTEHTATIELGTYEEDIGETTFNVFCNDANGFAVYAIGYSDNAYGNTAMKPSTLSDTNAIATGTATSGSKSNWAMKLTAVSGDYSPTLTTGFNDYHAVPDEYTKVAFLSSSTDATVGSSFKSTYAAYISQTQPADTYTGKVKYTVVHPASVNSEALSNAVTVNFDGNGLSFENGSETNTIQFAEVCDEAETAYVGTTHEDVGSSNLSSTGEKLTSYTDNENILQTITRTGADKLKVVVEYGITSNTITMMLVEGTWDGDWNNLPEQYDELYLNNNATGTKSFIVDGDTTTVFVESWGIPEAGYDYGFFVKVYPVYNTEQPNTILEDLPCNCWIQSVSGSYEETSTWKGKWELYVDNEIYEFYSESDLITYINNNYDYLKGNSITIIAHNPYQIVFNGNNATYGEMSDLAVNNLLSTVTLLAPNYYKTGYGFAGWSENSSATVGSNSIIYGPNATIDPSNLSFNGAHIATLYAVWVPSVGNMQNWTGCDNLNINDVTALRDIRDNQVYAVAKLADGNCWMIENLRLDFTTADVTTSNTDNPSADFISTNIANIKNGTDTQFWKQSTRFIKELSFDPSDISGGTYGYGVKYNWYTAVAGTVNGSSDTGTGSICPKGWGLPDFIYPEKMDYVNLVTKSSGTNMEFDDEQYGEYVNSAESSIDIRSYPINNVYAGYNYRYYMQRYRDYQGLYWSSNRTTLLIDYNMIIPNVSGDVGSPEAGQSIRCIAD